MRRLVAMAGLALGLFALVAQFAIIVPARMQDGGAAVSAVIYYFSFFTILTNTLLALVYLGAIVRGQRWLMLFRKPITRATAAATITLVGTYYHFMLSGLYQVDGLLEVCIVIMHYVAPVLYLIWFAVWNRTGTLKWAAIPRMLVYPLVYLVFILLRGAVTGEYPYPSFDVAALGYGPVAMTSVVLLAVLVVFNAAAIAIDRSLLASKRS